MSLQEDTDKRVIESMVEEMILSLEGMPEGVLKNTRCPLWMYNASIYLLKRLATVCNIDKETIKEHIDRVWEGKIYN